MNPALFGGGLGTMMGGLFGNSGAPYSSAMDQYQQWANKAEGVQNPFLNAGTAAIPDYQAWLGTMKDPTAFINSTMNQYQQSPWAQYEQQQAMRANQNMASASGLSGSTPMQLQAQQNATNISSQDMNQWLQNVLGINTQYGQGQAHLMGVGQESANALTNMYMQMARMMGAGAYGQKAGEQSDLWNTIGGAAAGLTGLIF